MRTSISNILEYWRAVELFSPQSLAKVNPNDRSEPVFALDQSLPLPWEDSHPFKSVWAPAKTSRRFLACCGVLELAQMRSVLEEKLGRDPESFLKESPDTETRIDVTKSIETQFRQLSPALFPRGRWPSNGHHPLVFSQQFAINTAVQDLGNAKGIFAVNGPPGTGKTTLLRDLISSIVVERAQRLSELSHPDAAFNGEGRWKVDKFNRVVALWKDQFKGFEIVIASNNNGAVENVSFEIPSRDAVDESWLKESDYFADFGTRLLDRPAWAMLAARLGNKANRGDFANKFWYGAKDGKRLSANDISGDGFLNWLKSLEGQQFDWKKATEKYKVAVAHEQKLRTAHINIFNDYASLIALSREIPTVEKLIVALEKNHAHMREQQSHAED